jgi:hypothetical protein
VARTRRPFAALAFAALLAAPPAASAAAETLTPPAAAREAARAGSSSVQQRPDQPLLAPPGGLPAFLLPARRATASCGPLASRAAAVLVVVARPGRLESADFTAMRAFAAGEEALRHPDLAALVLAVAHDEEVDFEEVGAVQRDAILDALMGEIIPRSECLPEEASSKLLLGRLLYLACAALGDASVEVARWALDPLRPFLLLSDRVGSPLPDDCRHALRRELGDPAEMWAPVRGGPPLGAAAGTEQSVPGPNP